ncbi:MAG: alanine--glyoxylate aminotransferase family protein [Synergistales bacterium]|nr:alanine--glyoxylate aminotransferase family protein [Synergistales bacterium]
MNRYLFTPGPVPIPNEGAAALKSHREPGFSVQFEKIQGSLRKLMRTDQPVLLLPCSGTGSLEALCLNLIGPGEKVISVSCGEFGLRFRDIARSAGAEIIPVDIPAGQGVRSNHVLSALERYPDAVALLLTHNETSTGVMNPLEEIMGSVNERGPLVLVDGVSSLGAMPCFPQDWNFDGLASCSQKGLLTPPGIGVVWLSERAWRSLEKGDRKRGSYYFDLLRHREYLEKDNPQNPFTPPVSLLATLEGSLDLILEQGTTEWFRKKRRLAETFMAGMISMGLEPFVKESAARSPGVSSLLLPSSAGKVKDELLKMGIVVSGGQGEMKGKILRFAHYSDWGWPETCLLMGSIFAALDRSGLKPGPEYISQAWETWKKGEK